MHERNGAFPRPRMGGISPGAGLVLLPDPRVTWPCGALFGRADMKAAYVLAAYTGNPGLVFARPTRM